MKKYCPFLVKIEQVNQGAYEYDENGNYTSHSSMLREVQHPVKCRGKECGAWRFGRCRRR